ncbi:MAG: ABC transporter permease [Steroidobacteraceae bacterium]
MSGNLGAVLSKEMLDTLRDKRSLSMLAVFVLIYPLIMWATLNNSIGKATRAERETIEMFVIGGERVPTLLQKLAQDGITVIARSDMDEAAIAAALRERKQAAILKIPAEFSGLYEDLRPARIELWFDSATDQDARLRKVEKILRSYGNDIAQSRLLAHGVSPAILTPVPLQLYDTATGASRSTRFIGAIFGIFFVATFYFCMNLAIDATAGERERRSLEILLAQPVRPLELIAGKWLAGAALCAAGLSLELLVGHSVLKSMPLEEIGLSWRLGLPNLLLLAVTALPLCLFAAAFEIALAMNSKSFKEAQAAVTFALLLPIIPVVVVPMMNVSTQQWMYAIPVLAEQTLLLELAKGNAVSPQSFLTAAGVSLAMAAICIGFAGIRLKSERFVLSV